MAEKFIITGSRGYIGSNLLPRLQKLGKVLEAKGDLSVKQDVEQYKGYENSIIIHLAGGHITKCANDPEKGFQDTVVTTLNVMELAKKIGAKRILIASSGAIYGNAVTTPIPETQPLKPLSNYGFYKLLSEEIGRHYSVAYKIPTIAMRFSSITGGKNMKGIIPSITARLKERNDIQITGDGSQARSYLYINDLMEAILLLTNAKISGFEAINIGSKDSMEIVKVIELIEKEMDAKPEHKFVKKNPEDVDRMHLDISKIAKLGWEPKYKSSEALKQSMGEALGKSRS